MKKINRVDYQNGKIYKIVSDKTDYIYIGSTAKKYLCQRLGNHKEDYKAWIKGKKNYCTSFEVLKYGDAKIILIESYPCNSKDELRARENYYQKEYKTNGFNLVNFRNAVVDWEMIKQNKKAYKKLYSEKHKEKIRELRKIWGSRKIRCDICDIEMCRASFSRHCKSPKHIEKINKQNE